MQVIGKRMIGGPYHLSNKMLAKMTMDAWSNQVLSKLWVDTQQELALAMQRTLERLTWQAVAYEPKLFGLSVKTSL